MPRTETENEKIRNKRRKLILEKSLILFAMKGYKAVSIDEIADASGCAHSLMYHYFNSKEEIYQQVLELAKNRIRSLINVEEMKQIDSPKETIKLIIDKFLEGLNSKNKNKVASSTILILNTAFEDDEKLKLDENKRPWHMFLNKIIEGQEKKEFPDGNPKEYVATLLAFIRGVAIASIGIKKEYFVIPSSEIIMKTLERSKQ